MLVLLVVLPCLILGGAAVVVLDRMGYLTRWESGGTTGRSGGGSSLLESVPRAALVASMGLMAAWILAWLVFLVIGLNALAS